MRKSLTSKLKSEHFEKSEKSEKSTFNILKRVNERV